MTEKKIEQYIGLCRAAGGVTTGVDLVLGEVRRRRAAFVLIADDASERTGKQIRDKCESYHVAYYPAGRSAEELARILGKTSACAAAAFTGRGPCRALLTILEERARGDGHENTEEKEKTTTEADTENTNGNAAMTERMIVDGSKTDIDV